MCHNLGRLRIDVTEGVGIWRVTTSRQDEHPCDDGGIWRMKPDVLEDRYAATNGHRKSLADR